MAVGQAKVPADLTQTFTPSRPFSSLRRASARLPAFLPPRREAFFPGPHQQNGILHLWYSSHTDDTFNSRRPSDFAPPQLGNGESPRTFEFFFSRFVVSSMCQKPTFLFPLAGPSPPLPARTRAGCGHPFKRGLLLSRSLHEYFPRRFQLHAHFFYLKKKNVASFLPWTVRQSEKLFLS